MQEVVGSIPIGSIAQGCPQASNTKLRMSIIAVTAQEAKGIPAFRVTVENIGDKDAVLNLGMMLANGKVHRPT